MPLPIWIDDPVPVTVTVLPVAVKAVGAGRISVPLPLTSIELPSTLVRAGRVRRSAVDFERAAVDVGQGG